MRRSARKQRQGAATKETRSDFIKSICGFSLALVILFASSTLHAQQAFYGKRQTDKVGDMRTMTLQARIDF